MALVAGAGETRGRALAAVLALLGEKADELLGHPAAELLGIDDGHGLR